jgi:rRNA maturation endonuclease Nob1
MEVKYAIMIGLGALLIQWVYNKLVMESKATKAYQEACVHNDKIVFAFDDPRWPVAICQICGRQESRKPVRPIPCPHCGKDIREDNAYQKK